MKNFLLLAALGICLHVGATTYYASPNGNGNGNSYATPCSLSEGLDHLSVSGDTLYLLGGRYNIGNTKIANKNGSASGRIVIAGYPGEEAILDFRSTAYGTRGLQIASSCTYLHIKDLALCYSGKNNLYNEGSYCLFENLDIYGSADTGCQMKNGGYNVIKNVDSHDNFDYEHYGSDGADFGGNADGFADKQHSGAPNHYIGCRSWNNSDDGWDFFDRNTSGYSGETIIEDCICYHNGPAEYNMQGHPRYQVDKKWFDDINGTTITNRYGQNQVVTLQHYPNHGNGNGFKIGGNYSTHNVMVHHCLAVANTVKGFDQNNDNGTMHIYNCTGYANGNNFGFAQSDASKGGRDAIYIQNCVSYRAKNGDFISTNTIRANDHNSWTMSSITPTDSYFAYTDTTHILDARDADGNLPALVLALFSPATASPLIDAGTNVALPFGGNAPDLGWRETGTIVIPASVSCTSGETEQYVTQGQTITPIVFRWDGTATSLAITPTPSNYGFNAAVDASKQTLTLTGAPTNVGLTQFTVSTVGGETSMSIAVRIHAKSASARQIAYVTIPGSAEDEAILDAINRFDTLSFTILNANETHDYSAYDIIVLSPKPNSGAKGYEVLKGYNKPMLVLKPFIFKSSVWNWGDSQNTPKQTVSMTTEHHYWNYGLTWTDPLDEPQAATADIDIFSEVTQNGLTYIKSWYNCTGGQDLQRIPEGSWLTAFDAGSTLNGTTLTQPLIMLGISEYSTANLTTEGKQLVCNLIFHLLGMEPMLLPEPVTALPATHSAHATCTGIYTIMGQYVGAESNWQTLPRGLYIVNGKKYIK